MPQPRDMWKHHLKLSSDPLQWSIRKLRCKLATRPSGSLRSTFLHGLVFGSLPGERESIACYKSTQGATVRHGVTGAFRWPAWPADAPAFRKVIGNCPFFFADVFMSVAGLAVLHSLCITTWSRHHVLCSAIFSITGWLRAVAALYGSFISSRRLGSLKRVSKHFSFVCVQIACSINVMRKTAWFHLRCYS